MSLFSDQEMQITQLHAKRAVPGSGPVAGARYVIPINVFGEHETVYRPTGRPASQPTQGSLSRSTCCRKAMAASSTSGDRPCPAWGTMT